MILKKLEKLGLEMHVISECKYCFSLEKGRIRRGLCFCEIFFPFFDFKVVWLHLDYYPFITEMLASIDHQFTTICFKTLRVESTCLQFHDCCVFKLSLHGKSFGKTSGLPGAKFV